MYGQAFLPAAEQADQGMMHFFSFNMFLIFGLSPALSPSLSPLSPLGVPRLIANRDFSISNPASRC